MDGRVPMGIADNVTQITAEVDAVLGSENEESENEESENEESE